MIVQRLIIFSSLLLAITAAFAKAPNNKFGAGFEVSGNRLIVNPVISQNWSQNDLDGQNSAGYGLYVDYRWRRFAAELGYGHIENANFPGFVVKNYNIYLDWMYYYPIWNNFELKGLVGIGLLNTYTTGSKPSFINNYYRSCAIRAGIGGQKNFTENFSVGLIYKFEATADNVAQFYWYINTIALYGTWYFG